VIHALVLAIAVGAGAIACSKPKPPTVVPKEAKVVGVEQDGVTLDLKVEMTNPNAFPLSVQRVSGRVNVDGVDLGAIDVPHALALAPNTPTLVQVPTKVRWEGAAALATIATKGRDIPFRVDGNVGVGGERLSVDVPFSQTGVITQAQLQQAVIRSIQKHVLPGLQ
jgi:LEA14-like dessication related protein